MSGIYISGMEMPKEGTVFVIDSMGQVWSNEWPTRGYTRLDGVTAVPVPPHGMIYADALIEHMKTEADNFKPRNMYDDGLLAGYNAAIRTIRDFAPTIIPTEEGE